MGKWSRLAVEFMWVSYTMRNQDFQLAKVNCMMLLALETANDQCSVVLWNEQGVCARRFDDRPREQTRLLLPMIEAVLAEQAIGLPDLAAIAFSRGPASFSGIRINAAVTQALAWAHDLPVIAVSTLQATAQAAYVQHGSQRVLAVLDARMNEVYAAAYRADANGLMQAVLPEQLAGYDGVTVPQDWFDAAGYALVGSGAPLLSLAGYTTQDATIGARAEQIAQLGWQALQHGQTVSAEQALPVYLRDDAWKKLDAQRGNAAPLQP